MYEDQEDTSANAMPPEAGGEPPQAEPSESRKALVKEILSDVTAAKAYWEARFERMRKDQRLARGKQWEDISPALSSDDYYVANIIQRHIAQRTAALYAKNPRAVARRRETIDYTVWDGNPDTIAKAQEQLMMGAQTGVLDPNMLAIMQDFMKVQQRRELLDRIAKTMEIVYEYYVREQVIPFKKQMKRLVRRVITTGVGFVTLDFQRVMEPSPDVDRKIADATQQMARLENLAREFAAGDFDEAAAEYERLRVMIADLQSQSQIAAREGLTFDFPASTSVIPDPRCRALDGFVGADFVALEYFLTPSQIREVWDVDIGANYTQYVPKDKGLAVYQRADAAVSDKGKALACVYVVYHKPDGVAYVVCDGYEDFLREPAAPNVKLERFWPVFTLMFNECDSDEEIYPPSDVELLRHMQHDYNRARQGLREQRQANRPKTSVAAGRLTDEDKEKLKSHPANALIELEGMQPGEKITDVLQPVQMPPVDPMLYDTNVTFEDFLRTGGSQEANLGGTSSATATESSIAESSRLSSLASNVDDLDELLTELARGGGQVLLQEVSQKTVQEIAGVGAVWPEMSRTDIAKELYLEIEAGSSGRPNQAQQIQNFERMAPFLLQIPGIKPERLAKEAILRMDDKLDISDWLDPAQPSITAMNSQKQLPMPGDPNDPQAQGDEGNQNAAKPVEGEGDGPGPGRPPMDPNLDGAQQSGMTVN